MSWNLAIPILGDLIDKLIPDKEAANKAKLELLKESNKAEVEAITAQLSAINSEAQSADKWTSRARPSFLYVVYILILASLPMGVLYAFEPEVAGNIAEGFKQWLDAIPESIVTLFGVGYLGYTGARSWDKKNGVAK